LAGAVLIGAVGCIVLGSLTGIGILAVYLSTVFFFIYKKQEQGLYVKKRNTHTLFIRKNNLR
jgi:hypothetical protein